MSQQIKSSKQPQHVKMFEKLKKYMMMMTQQIGTKIKNGKFKMDQVGILELKNIMIEMKNLLPELNGRPQKAGVRIRGPRNYPNWKSEKKKWKKNEQRSRDCKTSTHLPT